VTIKTLYKAELKLIICGDINIDYIKDNDTKRQRYAVLLTYNLSAMVHFPTRSQGYSSNKQNSVALVRERTIPTERPPPVSEVSANFCG